MDDVDLLNEVIEKVLAAGTLLASEWQRPSGPRGIGDKAEVDLEIETQLRAELLALLDCDFWGEETGSRLSGAEFCWVVDPNDGTADFLQKRKGSAISVGLLRKSVPVLGVVYAPVTNDRGSDCIAWSEGQSGIYRNGQIQLTSLTHLRLEPGSWVLVSTGAASKPDLNAELCSPGGFIPMPSIAYRLASAAVGDGVAAISIVPVSAHDVVAGHAILRGAGGVLLNHYGQPVTYENETSLGSSSLRCFGGAPEACAELASRDWNKVLR